MPEVITSQIFEANTIRSLKILTDLIIIMTLRGVKIDPIFAFAIAQLCPTCPVKFACSTLDKGGMAHINIEKYENSKMGELLVPNHPFQSFAQEAACFPTVTL